jgi:hypothetical protein
MEQRQRLFLGLGVSLALLASLAAATLTSAKGNFSSILIIDLETGQVRLVDDPQLGGFFALSDLTNGSGEAPIHAKGYELWRLSEGHAGGLFAVDHLRYYTSGSQRHGYIFYEGIVNGVSEYDQKWFPSTPAGDGLMQGVLSRSGDQPAPAINSLAAVAILSLAFIVGCAAGFILARARGSKNDQLKAPGTSQIRAA